jgi:hypothetical protein
MRFAAVPSALSVVLLLAPIASAEIGFHYGWTISSSDSDPFSNIGAPAGGMATLYLWLQCVTKDGMASAELDLAVVGDGSRIVSFGPAPGFLNAGGPTNLLLAATGCPGDGDPAIPIVVGAILVIDFGAEYCIVPSAVNRRNGTVNCDVASPQAHPNSTIGYSSAGGPPSCDDSQDGMLCAPPRSGDATNWGRIRSTYH